MLFPFGCVEVDEAVEDDVILNISEGGALMAFAHENNPMESNCKKESLGSGVCWRKARARMAFKASPRRTIEFVRKGKSEAKIDREKSSKSAAVE